MNAIGAFRSKGSGPMLPNIGENRRITIDEFGKMRQYLPGIEDMIKKLLSDVPLIKKLKCMKGALNDSRYSFTVKTARNCEAALIRFEEQIKTPLNVKFPPPVFQNKQTETDNADTDKSSLKLSVECESLTTAGRGPSRQENNTTDNSDYHVDNSLNKKDIKELESSFQRFKNVGVQTMSAQNFSQCSKPRNNAINGHIKNTAAFPPNKNYEELQTLIQSKLSEMNMDSLRKVFDAIQNMNLSLSLSKEPTMRVSSKTRGKKIGVPSGDVKAKNSDPSVNNKPNPSSKPITSQICKNSYENFSGPVNKISQNSCSEFRPLVHTTVSHEGDSQSQFSSDGTVKPALLPQSFQNQSAVCQQSLDSQYNSMQNKQTLANQEMPYSSPNFSLPFLHHDNYHMSNVTDRTINLGSVFQNLSLASQTSVCQESNSGLIFHDTNRSVRNKAPLLPPPIPPPPPPPPLPLFSIYKQNLTPESCMNNYNSGSKSRNSESYNLEKTKETSQKTFKNAPMCEPFNYNENYIQNEYKNPSTLWNAYVQTSFPKQGPNSFDSFQQQNTFNIQNTNHAGLYKPMPYNQQQKINFHGMLQSCPEEPFHFRNPPPVFGAQKEPFLTPNHFTNCEDVGQSFFSNERSTPTKSSENNSELRLHSITSQGDTSDENNSESLSHNVTSESSSPSTKDQDESQSSFKDHERYTLQDYSLVNVQVENFASNFRSASANNGTTNKSSKSIENLELQNLKSPKAQSTEENKHLANQEKSEISNGAELQEPVDENAMVEDVKSCVNKQHTHDMIKGIVQTVLRSGLQALLDVSKEVVQKEISKFVMEKRKFLSMDSDVTLKYDEEKKAQFGKSESTFSPDFRTLNHNLMKTNLNIVCENIEEVNVDDANKVKHYKVSSSHNKPECVNHDSNKESRKKERSDKHHKKEDKIKKCYNETRNNEAYEERKETGKMLDNRSEEILVKHCKKRDHGSSKHENFEKSHEGKTVEKCTYAESNETVKQNKILGKEKREKIVLEQNDNRKKEDHNKNEIMKQVKKQNRHERDTKSKENVEKSKKHQTTKKNVMTRYKKCEKERKDEHIVTVETRKVSKYSDEIEVLEIVENARQNRPIDMPKSSGESCSNENKKIVDDDNIKRSRKTGGKSEQIERKRFKRMKVYDLDHDRHSVDSEKLPNKHEKSLTKPKSSSHDSSPKSKLSHLVSKGARKSSETGKKHDSRATVEEDEILGYKQMRLNIKKLDLTSDFPDKTETSPLPYHSFSAQKNQEEEDDEHASMDIINFLGFDSQKLILMPSIQLQTIHTNSLVNKIELVQKRFSSAQDDSEISTQTLLPDSNSVTVGLSNEVVEIDKDAVTYTENWKDMQERKSDEEFSDASNNGMDESLISNIKLESIEIFTMDEETADRDMPHKDICDFFTELELQDVKEECLNNMGNICQDELDLGITTENSGEGSRESTKLDLEKELCKIHGENFEKFLQIKEVCGHAEQSYLRQCEENAAEVREQNNSLGEGSMGALTKDSDLCDYSHGNITKHNRRVEKSGDKTVQKQRKTKITKSSRVQKPSRYKCEECGRQFIRKLCFAKHKLKKHMQNYPRSQQKRKRAYKVYSSICPFCGKSFANSSSVIAHVMFIHEKNHCDKQLVM